MLKEQIKELGYAIIPNVLTEQECLEYKKKLEDLYGSYVDKYFSSVVSSHGLDYKGNEKIVYNLHNKGIEFARLLDHPAILPHVESVLQEGSYLNAEPIAYQNSAARTPLRHAKAQQLHIDSRIPGAPFPLVLQVMWCLDDFTKENGATRIVPGSQYSLDFPENGKVYPNEISICARKGSVIIFNAGMWHGSGERTCESDRWGMILTYGRWFMRPSFDFNKNMPAELYEQLNDKQKELLGYKFNPPKDEFTRISRRSNEFEIPLDYKLP